MQFGGKAVIGVALMAMLIATSTPLSNNGTTEDSMMDWRLPSNTIPRQYNIIIAPNIGDFRLTWTGEVTIDIEVVSTTQILTLHANGNLTVDKNSTKLVDSDGQIFSPCEHDRHNEFELLILQFEHKISVGNYSLRLKYRGVEFDDMSGLMKISDGTEDSPMIVGTFFETTAARRVFPCWDEPGFKARFNISIEHLRNYTAMSNMPEIASVETAYDKNLTTFATTPLMSTYLVNFVIADYQTIYNKYGNVSLSGSPQSLKTTRYMIDLTSKVVDFMESYTGLGTGVPRIGSVLMPKFTPHALEQWGLISYRTDIVSINETVDTTRKKDHAAVVVAHELAHSWFGNRVTQLWWDDSWLSEAFASYFSYYALDKIYNSSRGLELLIVDVRQNLHFPIYIGHTDPLVSIPSKDTIHKMFTEALYIKGPSILHMFHNILGGDVFQGGIRKFLTKHSFKSAVTADLTAAFQEAYDENWNEEKPLNVTDAMIPWLSLRDFPIISVRRNYTSGETEVFHESSLQSDNDNVSTKCSVPLTHATKSNPYFNTTSPVIWLSSSKDSVKIDGIDKDDWIIFNIRASGYYHVEYDDENWNRLSEYLDSDNYKNIDVLTRVQLMNDAYNQLQTNRTVRNYEIFYKLTRYLSREVDYLPWRFAITLVEVMQFDTANTGVDKEIQTHFLELVQTFMKTVDFEVRDEDDRFTKLSRMDIISWACRSGDSRCSEYATEKLIRHMKNPEDNPLHPDTKSWLFCAGLRGLNDSFETQFYKWALENARSLLERNAACTENHEIHTNVLDHSFKKIFDGDLEEFENIFHTLLKSRDEDFDFAVDFMANNWKADIITNRIVNKMSITGRFIETVALRVSTEARLKKFDELLQLEAVSKELNDVDYWRKLAVKRASYMKDAANFYSIEQYREIPGYIKRPTVAE